MLEKFLKNFPPPEYMDVLYSAVVFSDSSVRFLSLDKNSKHPVFSSEVELEPGIIEMGQVKNEEALSKILSQKKYELRSPFVKFSIPDETSYVFTARVPVVADSSGNARESVAFILEENVPLPLSDISFDFAVEAVEEGFANVVVVAASTLIVISYVNALRKAGFEPLLGMNESQATAYSITQKNSKEISVIVHVHKKSAGIYVVNGNIVEFSTVVPVSPADSPEEAIKSIKAELMRALEYSAKKGELLEKKQNGLPCYLCGEHQILKNLSEEINGMENLRPSLGNVWLNVFSVDKYVPEISFEDSLRLASAVGLFSKD